MNPINAPSDARTGDVRTGDAHAVDVHTHANTYDETPYPDLSYAQTHPDRLATLGHLLGLTPQPVEKCRVLELGCAGGGNLLPMALNLPKSHFAGIDYSANQIEIGRQRMDSLGISNLQLLCMDVVQAANDTRLESTLGGKFDYIIAHGLYSWVAKPVRDAMFDLCKRLLAPQGILYVSYNTLPGWNVTRIVREAMLFHTRNAETPQDKTLQAREMVDFLATHVPDSHDAYRAVFRRYQSMLNDGMKGANEAFLLHDELEEVNDPVYFQEFAWHATEHGLQYFVEAELANVLPHMFGQEVMQKLQGMAKTAVELEQYMDFLRNRMFRQSLLCHAEVEPTRMLRPDPVMECYVRSEAEPETAFQKDARGQWRIGQGTVSFRGPDNATLTTDHPLSQAAFVVLRRNWPQALSFAELFDAAHAELGTNAPPRDDATRLGQERMVLADNLLRGHGHSSRLVGLHRMSPAIHTAPGKRPRAVAVARFEAVTRNAVTNLWHERVQIDEAKRQLLLLLDGTKPTSQLEPIWRVALQYAARTAPESSKAEDQKKYDALDFQKELTWLARAALLVP